MHGLQGGFRKALDAGALRDAQPPDFRDHQGGKCLGVRTEVGFQIGPMLDFHVVTQDSAIEQGDGFGHLDHVSETGLGHGQGPLVREAGMDARAAVISRNLFGGHMMQIVGPFVGERDVLARG